MNEQVRKRIDEHLDAIDRILTDSGMTRSERRNITDDVESQILDMLGARSGDDPTLPDVEAILAELDPPEAYGADAQGASAASAQSVQADAVSVAVPAFPRGLGITSLVLALVGSFGIVPAVVFMLVMIRDDGTQIHVSMTESLCLGLPFMALEFAALICGVIAWRHPCGKAGAVLSGLLLLIPLILLLRG